MTSSKLFRLAVVLGACGLSVILSPAGNSVADAVSHVLGLRGAAEIVPTNNRRNPASALAAKTLPPDITNAQVQRAREILGKSPAVTRLFHNVTYQVVHDGPWTTGGNPNTFLGVTLWLNLAHPANVAGSWPTVSYPPTGRTSPHPYISRNKYFAATALRSVTVEVDLAGERVAGVTPETFVSLHR